MPDKAHNITQKENINVKKLIEKIKAVLIKDPQIVFAILFGSQARGDAFSFSDIDIGIYVTKDTAYDSKYKFLLMHKLSKALEVDNVDLIILNEAPPALRYEILTTGILILCRDDDLYAEFYSLSLREYFDFRYILQQFYDNAIKELSEEK
ncbi:MAG: type VII toxin-antitoxin system MntA family adenylyltransferase antitoxin [Candidatus Asgardarchaeia archaeon]